MTTNQGLQQASVRGQTGTALDYNGDWSALFDQAGIPAGPWSGRMLAYINGRLGTSYTSVPSAMQAFAAEQGYENWASMGIITFLADFVFTVETTGAAETFTIPCQNVGTFDAEIDWGDGSTSTITAYNDADLAHEYATADTYTIAISGTFPNIYFNNAGDKAKVRTVEALGDVGWATLNNAFYGCSGMTSFTSGSADTSGVTNLTQMLRACTGLTTADLTGMDTSSVSTVQALFHTCSALTTVDVSGLDTSSLGTMTYMFLSCANITSIDLSDWDVSGVTSFFGTFSGCTSLATLDSTGWTTTSATSMASMFALCSSLTSLDVSGWDTSSVESMTYMFQDCDGLTDIRIDLWDIEAVTNFSNFMSAHAGLTTARYDATLIAWDAQNPVDSLSVHFGGSKYTGGGAAATARANLISTDSWAITDGGIAP